MDPLPSVNKTYGLVLQEENQRLLQACFDPSNERVLNVAANVQAQLVVVGLNTNN